jgi:integrase
MPKVLKMTARQYRNAARPTLKWRVLIPKFMRLPGEKEQNYFKSKEDANGFIQRKQGEFTRLEAAPELPAAIRRVVAENLKKLPQGYTLDMVFKKFFEGAGIKPRTFKDVGDEFLALAKARCEAVTYNGYYYRITILCRTFGERDVNGITTKELDSYLTEQVGAKSRRHYRSLLRSLFEHADVARNPMAKSVYRRMRTPRRGMPRVYAPSQMRAMLDKILELIETDVKRAQRWKSLLWQFALGGFAHVRPFECLRLDWRMIDLERNEIRITEQIAKVKSAQRTVKIQPNLKAWLLLYSQQEGPIATGFKNEKARYYFRTELLARLAGKPKAPVDMPVKIEWVHDGLRHSSASYHLKHFQKRDELIEELGHGDASMLVEHYRNAMVSAEDAAAWWRIFPPARQAG